MTPHAVGKVIHFYAWDSDPLQVKWGVLWSACQINLQIGSIIVHRYPILFRATLVFLTIMSFESFSHMFSNFFRISQNLFQRSSQALQCGSWNPNFSPLCARKEFAAEWLHLEPDNGALAAQGSISLVVGSMAQSDGPTKHVERCRKKLSRCWSKVGNEGSWMLLDHS